MKRFTTQAAMESKDRPHLLAHIRFELQRPKLSEDVSPPDCKTIGELERIANRIKERDATLLDAARSNWLKTGDDLLAARNIFPHGGFEPWCTHQLSYSKSKAEKLMRAAAVLGPQLKSVKITDIPPPSIAYKLSAGSVPAEIRDDFLPRALKGEKIGPLLTRALKAHRAAVAKGTAVEDNGAAGNHNSDEAIARAAKLIANCLGDALPDLLKLAAKTGPNRILAEPVERELRAAIARAAESDGGRHGEVSA